MPSSFQTRDSKKESIKRSVKLGDILLDVCAEL